MTYKSKLGRPASPLLVSYQRKRFADSKTMSSPYPKKTLTKIQDICFRVSRSRASIVKVVKNPASKSGSVNCFLTQDARMPLPRYRTITTGMNFRKAFVWTIESSQDHDDHSRGLGAGPN